MTGRNKPRPRMSVSESGALGGAAGRGPAKARDKAHYAEMGRKSGLARKKKRELAAKGLDERKRLRS